MDCVADAEPPDAVAETGRPAASEALAPAKPPGIWHLPERTPEGYAHVAMLKAMPETSPEVVPEAVQDEDCVSSVSTACVSSVSTALPEAVSRVSAHEAEHKSLLEAQQAPDAAAKIAASLTLRNDLFSERAIAQIEQMLDGMVEDKEKGLFTCANTVDSTAKRTKYFFGYGYTYGQGMSGREALLPPGHVDPIPNWVRSHVISPLVKSGLVPAGWIDSVVINDYRAGGSIVAHVDPLKLFARPILTATFFGSARLVFGASFDPKRTQPPIYAQLLSRGSVLLLDGHAANEVTHGMRPEDMLGDRRVSIVLRHVLPDAPKTTGITGFTAITPEARSRLIRGVQGSWRATDSRTIYIVEQLKVTVLMAAPDADKVSVDSYSRKSTWRLLPKEHGLICNTGILTPGGLSQDRLEWRLSQDAQKSFGWIRLDQELSSSMLKLALQGDDGSDDSESERCKSRVSDGHPRDPESTWTSGGPRASSSDDEARPKSVRTDSGSRQVGKEATQEERDEAEEVVRKAFADIKERDSMRSKVSAASPADLQAMLNARLGKAAAK